MGIEARTAAGVTADRIWRRRSVVDVHGLARAVRLLGAAFLPIAVPTALIWAAVYLMFRLDPDRTRYLAHSLSHTIIHTQLDRLREVGTPSLAFVGDSACLMDIHVPTLRRMLSDDRIESFCTIAHVGPVGYAHMIDMLRERGTTPDRLVIAMHPVSFPRQPDWDWATRLVVAGGRDPDYDARKPSQAIPYLRAKWLGAALPSPLLGGGYALYYIGFPAVARTIRSDHGSAADPQTALAFRSVEEFSRAVASTRRPAVTSHSYTPNAAFNSGLEALAKAVERIGATRVYLLLTPVSDLAFSAETERAHHAAALDIARRLGVPASNILAQEGHVPNEYLSDTAHMNRWGRILYTMALARHLAPDAASH